MSVAPGWTMMAWVWVSLVTLARLNTAEEPTWEAHGGGLNLLLSHSEPRGVRGFSPVSVWKFVEEHRDGGDDGEASGFGPPRYGCGNGSMTVCFSRIHHANLRLHDGRRLLRQNRCHVTIQTMGPWLFLKFPYASCHIASWTSNGTRFHQLKLRYFNHLLQTSMTGVATCQRPPPLRMTPLVACRARDVLVILPPGTKIKRVKALGKDGVTWRAHRTISGVVFVKIAAEMDSFFEIIYQDPEGEMTTALATCFSALAQSGQKRYPRDLEEVFDTWGFGGDSLPPNPDETPITTEAPSGEENGGTFLDGDNEDIDELWGFPNLDETPITTEAPSGGEDGTLFEDIDELWEFPDIPGGTSPSTTMAPSTTIGDQTTITAGPSSISPSTTTTAAATSTTPPATSTTAAATSTTAAATSTTAAATSTTVAATSTTPPPTSTTAAATSTTPATTSTTPPPTSTTAAATSTTPPPTSTTPPPTSTTPAPTSTTPPATSTTPPPTSTTAAATSTTPPPTAAATSTTPPPTSTTPPPTSTTPPPTSTTPAPTSTTAAATSTTPPPTSTTPPPTSTTPPPTSTTPPATSTTAAPTSTTVPPASSSTTT